LRNDIRQIDHKTERRNLVRVVKSTLSGMGVIGPTNIDKSITEKNLLWYLKWIVS